MASDKTKSGFGEVSEVKKGSACLTYHDGRVKLLWRSGTVRNEMGAQGR